MRGIMADPDIRLSFLPCNLLDNRVLQHANAVVAGLPADCCFKIGQTVDPANRWQNADYGYKSSILNWSTHPSCLNEAGGGEAISKQEGPFFVYVVVSNTV